MRIIFHPSFGDSQACRWWDTPRVWFVTHQNLIPYSLCSGERFLVGWLLKKELEGGRRYHPRRPRGGQSGREKRKRARRKFSSTGGKAPGYRISPDHFQTVKRMLAPAWAQNCFVSLSRLGERHLLSSFRECVHDGCWIDHGLSGSCTEEMHAVRKLSVWYKLSNSICCLPKN